jgi:uncharacterized protein YceK
MRPSPRVLPVAFLVGLAGCGTVHNLNAPPRTDTPMGLTSMGPSTCFPFGGVARSGLQGCFGPPFGIATMVEGDVIKGGGVFGLGLLAWADIPLSLAGDVLTLPIAYARSNGEPWATWWGEKEIRWRTPPAETEAVSPVLEPASSGKP